MSVLAIHDSKAIRENLQYLNRPIEICPGPILLRQSCHQLPIIGSRALALADQYCHIAWNSVGLFVCVSATLRSNISETKGARAKVTMGS